MGLPQRLISQFMIVCIKDDIDHPLNEPAVQVGVRGETINCVWTEVTARAALVAVPEHRAYGVSLTSDWP